MAVHRSAAVEVKHILQVLLLFMYLWGVISWGIWGLGICRVLNVYTMFKQYLWCKIQIWDFRFAFNTFSFEESDKLDFYCHLLIYKHRYTIWVADSEVAYFEQCSLYVCPPLIVCQLPPWSSLPFGLPSSQTAPGQSARQVLPAPELCTTSCCSQQHRQCCLIR